MKHSGTIVTALIAVIAFSVQWGVVTTKLDQMEKRLDEFILEAKAVRKEYSDLKDTLRVEHAALEYRISYLEGLSGVKHKEAAR